MMIFLQDFITKNKNLRIKSLRDNNLSHHSMGAFFSGQDNKMLRQEGNDMNCFVSLVVDTRGTYVAAITRKIQTKSEVTVKPIGTSYEFFGDGPIALGAEDTPENKKIIDKEAIEVFKLEVQREEVVNPLEWLDVRFAEIEKNKANSKPKYTTLPDKDFYLVDWPDGTDFRKEQKQETLFTESEMKGSELPFEEPLDYSNFTDYIPNPDKIKDAVAHMLLCSLTVNTQGFDPEKYINEHMVKIYDRIFPEPVKKPNGRYQYSAFDNWCDFIIEFLIDNFNDPSMPKDLGPDIKNATIAFYMKNELDDYAGSNKYIDDYILALERYIEM